MSDFDDAIVYIVDDDPGIRESLTLLLASFGMRSEAFASATEYLAQDRPDAVSCLVLDLELPDIHGLDLQLRIGARDPPHVVFISGHGDIPSTVRAMRAGAIDFLTKPFREADLMRAIGAALDENRSARARRAEAAELTRRFARLTEREREVLPLVVSGLLNKQAAAELGISEITLQIHRGNVMRKMDAASLPDLVRMAAALGIPTTQGRRSRS